MSVELRPLGILCNIQCQYCYQNPQRDAGNITHSYDIDKMKLAVEAEGGPFTLFGGEPLLLPLSDLETLWSWGYQRYGSNCVQTNGTLIRDQHIQLFHMYRVGVGLSLDGPEELNDVRWHGNLQSTRLATSQAQLALERLCREGLRPTLMITLHSLNARGARLPRLIEWVRGLSQLGLGGLRLHLLESETATIRSRYGLTTGENVEALLAFLNIEPTLPEGLIDLFPEMRRLLRGDDRRTTCVWHACDPYTTTAVRGIEGSGQRSNCGRTNKDGVDFVKAPTVGFERYVALYETSQDVGGCKGCRFFLMCKGQCPGTAIDGDWRNRTEHCDVWKAIFQKLENELLEKGEIPLSLWHERPDIEEKAIVSWSRGRQVSVASLVGLSPPSKQTAKSPLVQVSAGTAH